MPPGSPGLGVGALGVGALGSGMSQDALREHLALADREISTMKHTVMSADAAREANRMLLEEKENTIQEQRLDKHTPLRGS